MAPVIVRMCRPFDGPDVRSRCPICAEFVEATARDEIEACAHLGFAYLTACSEFADVKPHAEADVDRVLESDQVNTAAVKPGAVGAGQHSLCRCRKNVTWAFADG